MRLGILKDTLDGGIHNHKTFCVLVARISSINKLFQKGDSSMIRTARDWITHPSTYIINKF